MSFDVFFKGKTVLITGHTGFIGSWLSKTLTMLGAKVIGYSLEPPSEPNLFNVIKLHSDIISINGDVRDESHFLKVLGKYNPEIVFHLAALPIVLDSLNDPVETFDTNVIGTAKVLNSIRINGKVKSVIVMTSDKSYKNREWIYPYREIDEIGGKEPYSASKACEDIVVNSFSETYFKEKEIGVSSIRAGNVIGGGDWGHLRLVPDIVNSLVKEEPLVLRNPDSVRPWQYVLDLVNGILKLTIKLMENPKAISGAYNIGPSTESFHSVLELASMFSDKWGKKIDVVSKKTSNIESRFLSLDTNKIKNMINYTPRYDFEKSLLETVKWYKSYYSNQDIKNITENQIGGYFDEF